MQVPSGLDVPYFSLVCKLQKSLYGLKQASRQWNAKLTLVLVAFGYYQSKLDNSLFTKATPSGFTTILVYVDDLALVGDDLHEIQHMKALLDDKFKIKDLGYLKFFLGMEVVCSKKGIALYQRKYCLDLSKTMKCFGCKPISTPIDYTLKLSKDSGPLLEDMSSYCKLIGRLLYFTHTQLDICYAIGRLSQFLDHPIQMHHQVAHKVLRYLKNSLAQGLYFSSSSDLTLLGFVDSNQGSSSNSRRSIFGYCFFLGSSLISWRSKKQTTVTRSLFEAKYISLAQATCQAQWLAYLLKHFQIPIPQPIVIYCDNLSAIHITSNLVFHE